MGRYKVNYTCVDDTTSYRQRISGYDIFEADSAQDAMDQCRQEFYIENQMDVTSVCKWSPLGYWMPVFDNAWK